MEKIWNSPRFKGIKRPYTAKDVERLRGTIHVEHSIARLTSEKLWKLFETEDYVNALGALTGNQAMQMAKAGLKAIYRAAGKWQPTPITQAKCTPTRAFIRQTAFPPSCARSIIRCAELTRSTIPKARIRTFCCRS